MHSETKGSQGIVHAWVNAKEAISKLDFEMASLYMKYVTLKHYTPKGTYPPITLGRKRLMSGTNDTNSSAIIMHI
ncbi:hypothetical protein SpiGrapes_2784 [Sphaerochaeta pleomorpha str. Grapes]|uniref:Uncharacterized protein n=1 Tax=Sphaerochaeta pleomorpha (strain ATCC BAA-1885 / DSM 22778 / Grapes) TaxID=158190 RepID=G8QWG5_SPHPG|nr:hypothetical protein SpiGrapes_2784 [Sphaerochaeta pleomorpha str. Grapes]